MNVRSVTSVICELFITVFYILGFIITVSPLVALPFRFSLFLALTLFVVMYSDIHFLHCLNGLAVCNWEW